MAAGAPGAGFAGLSGVAASRPHRFIVKACLTRSRLRTSPTLLHLPLRVHRGRHRKGDQTQHSNTKKNDSAYHKETDERITLTEPMIEQQTRTTKQAE